MNQPKLRSQVFLQQDIAAVLRALYDVHVQAFRGVPTAAYEEGYQAGFAAAIRAAATALHIDPSFAKELPEVLSGDFRVLSEEVDRQISNGTLLLPESDGARVIG